MKNKAVIFMKYYSCISLSTPRRRVGGIEVQLPSFLNSALDGGERSSACLGRSAPGNKPGTHWIGGCVSPEQFWRLCRKQKLFSYNGIRKSGSISRCLFVIPTALSWTDWEIPRNVSFRAFAVAKDIRNGFLPNIIRKSYCLKQLPQIKRSFVQL
jgi:hypothetical protein